MPKLRIPPAYRGPTGGQEMLEVTGASVGACLDAAEARFPGLRAQVVAEDGSVHRFVSLFVNGERLERDALETAVRPEDEIQILAAIGGGAGDPTPSL